MPDGSPGPEAHDQPAVSRRDLLPVLACAAVGVTLSILPNLLWWPRLGAPHWIADFDEVGFYAQVAGAAYFNHPFRLSDPSSLTDGPTYYPWVQFVPAVLLARAAHLGPLGADLLLRVWAGLSLAVTGYLVLRHFLGRPRLAAALTVFLLSDSGLTQCLPVLRQAGLVADYVRGPTRSPGGGPWSLYRFDMNYPDVLFQFRLITPGVGLGFLWFQVWMLARARSRPTPARLLGAGLSYGLLFYVYFYYWTAASVALVFAWLLDPGGRRVYWRTAWVGGLLGLPALASGAQFKRAASPDWPPRNDLFVPVGRFRELMVPRKTIALVALALVWVRARRRDLTYLWALMAASLLLLNHQVVTGLQIENFHWFSFLLGPCYGVFLALAAVDAVGRLGPRAASPPARWALWGALAVYTATGYGLRAFEATAFREPRVQNTAYLHYRTQRAGPDAPRLAGNSVTAGDRPFVDLAAVLDNQRPLDSMSLILSPTTDDATWDARVALNEYLLGRDRPAFLRAQREQADRGTFGINKGPWRRDRASAEARFRSRMAAFDAVARDPDAALDRFRVRYLALPHGPPPPDSLARRWRRLQGGPFWDLWERRR